jgi:hypothetical protein
MEKCGGILTFLNKKREGYDPFPQKGLEFTSFLGGEKVF